MASRSKLLGWGVIICLVIIGGAFLIYKLGASSPATPAPKPLTTTTTTGTCGVVPLDVLLVIDRSESMVNPANNTGTPPQTRLYYAEHAADALVDQLDQNGGLGGRDHPAHQIGVISFAGTGASGVTINVPLGNSSAAAAKNAINNLQPGSSTPFKQALQIATQEMSGHHRNLYNARPVERVVIFLSDGSPVPADTATPALNDITNYVASADVAYAIAIGQNKDGQISQGQGVDINLMGRLAKPAPANLHQVTTADQLPSLFSNIFTQIACQSADLSLNQAVDQAAPKQNDTVTFTLTVNNTGPDTANNITVKDALPTGLTATTPLPAGYDGTTWTVGTIATGAKAALTIAAKVGAVATTKITNTAEIMSSSVADPDSTPGNGVTTEDDYATTALTVAAAATTVTPPDTTVATPPATPTPTPAAPAATPTAAPSSGFGGLGQLFYGLILLTLVGFGLIAQQIRRAKA
ncbi:MAG TPA: VWA domain-containing protein [Candidatus Saccharimonadales bacterium]|nr:VWA domain-containing protein [Candidatus Saccharimonadales bacterium]